MNKRTFGMAPGARMALDRAQARRKAVKHKPKQSVVKKEPMSRQELAFIDYTVGPVSFAEGRYDDA